MGNLIGSNNEFPSVLFAEQASAPTTPGTGLWRAYFKSDGLYIVDDAGTETGPLSTGGSLPTLVSDKVTLTSGNVSITGTTFIDVTGLSITVTTGARRCLVGYAGSVFHATSGATGRLDLAIDGTRVGGTNGGLMEFKTATTNQYGNGSFTFLTDTLTAASHTFKIQANTSVGTFQIIADGTDSKAIFWVQEVL